MRWNGFTLIELLVTLAIGSVVLIGVFLSIYQIITSTDRNASMATALADVSQASRAIKRDLMMTQITDLVDGEPPQNSVNLSWTDYTGFSSANGSNHYSTYTLSGTRLLRVYDGVTSIVGRNVTSVSFSKSGPVISVNITSTGPPAAKSTENLYFTSVIRTEGGS